MNEFTFGDLITLESILVEKLKNVDLSLHAGQYMVALLGKIEYQISNLETQATAQIPLNPEALAPLDPQGTKI